MIMNHKFNLGQVVMTRTLNEWVQQDPARYEFLQAFMARHQSGDWGNVCEEDAQVNADALIYGNRILSLYEHEGTFIWIITEADRSVTTILFPSDY